MELDETDPTVWLKLEGATDEYIQNNSTAFKNLAERLLESTPDEKVSDNVKSQQNFRAKGTSLLFTLTRSLVSSFDFQTLSTMIELVFVFDSIQ